LETQATAQTISGIGLTELRPYITNSSEGGDAENTASRAALKTNQDQETLLKRADDFAKESLYDTACGLWQSVLNNSGDTLTSTDDQVYFAMSVAIEDRLAKLPPEGLRAYRVIADGEAMALLAGEKNREKALAEVARRYFMSSLGDDAAYELGCLALDRHDFVGAARMFDKVLNKHPDPTPPRGEVLIRFAFANARLGDSESATKAYKQVAESPGRPSREALTAVEHDISLVHRPTSTGSHGDWLMAYGNATRQGYMPALPAATMSSKLTEIWGYTFPIDVNSADRGKVFRGGYSFLPNAVPSDSPSATHSDGERYVLKRIVVSYDRIAVAPQMQMPAEYAKSMESLIPRWVGNHWRPSGQLLFHEGNVIFKTHNDITSWNTSVKTREPNWRSVWVNQYWPNSSPSPVPNSTHARGWQRPSNPTDIMLFGDRVRYAMSVCDGVVYSVEGERQGRIGERVGVSPGANSGQQLGSRARSNFLTAYDAKTGKPKWRHEPVSPVAEGLQRRVGFLAAPVAYGHSLLVPVMDDDSLYIYALSRDTGEALWKSYLCDNPADGAWPWQRVCIAIDGRDAYINSGSGVIFSIDASSGAIRMAIGYDRNLRPGAQLNQNGYGGGFVQLDGWDEDVVIPYGKGIMVMATDSNYLSCYDRRSGKLLWRSPRKPFPDQDGGDYYLGMRDGQIYVAGHNVLRRYDGEFGNLRRQTEHEDSFGRGVLTEDAVYIPLRNQIVKYDLETLEEIGRVDVSLATEEPIGNLYSDGEKLWVQSANRVYALTTLEHRLALLEESVKAGNPNALLERMQLRLQADKIPGAFEDLRTAFANLEKEADRQFAIERTLDLLSENNLAESEPERTLRYLADVGVDQNGSLYAEIHPDTIEQMGQLVSTSLQGVKRDSIKGLAETALKLQGTLPSKYQRPILAQALVATAGPADKKMLMAAVATPETTGIALEAFAAVAGKEAVPQLTKLAKEGKPEIRYASARALANLGDRSSIAAFIALMESDLPTIRSRSASSLQALTGEEFGFNAYGTVEERTASIENWQDWAVESGGDVKLIVPLPDVKAVLGRTLIAFYGQNKIVELDSSGKVRWQQTVPNPWACQGLPNGHRLVACYSQNLIIEYDAEGKEVWRKTGLPGNPFSVQRLENGNTLTACSNSERVVEIAPDGKIVWNVQVSGRPMDARRLPDGQTIVALANTNSVVLVDKEGKIQKTVSGRNGAVSVQPLENGNILVAQMNDSHVAETDWSGKVIWSRAVESQPYDIQRTLSGSTLVAGDSGVYELTNSGKILWRYKDSGASGVSRF